MPDATSNAGNFVGAEQTRLSCMIAAVVPGRMEAAVKILERFGFFKRLVTGLVLPKGAVAVVNQAQDIIVLVPYFPLVSRGDYNSLSLQVKEPYMVAIQLVMTANTVLPGYVGNRAYRKGQTWVVELPKIFRHPIRLDARAYVLSLNTE